MHKPFIAIFTETRSAGVPPTGSVVVSTAVPAPTPSRDAVTAALLVVFANRDAQTLEDVEGTRLNLESQGEGPHVREFDFLREIPDLLPVAQTFLSAGSGDFPVPSSRATEDSEADRIIPEHVGPVPSPGAPPNDPALSIPNSQLSTECVSAIHQCLQLLAGCCDGARTLDGAGFNKLDTEFGHSLAHSRALSPKQAVHGQKLIRKYHRQLPADLLQAALGEGTACPLSGGAPVSDPAPPDASDPSAPSGDPSPTGVGEGVLPSRGSARADEGSGENPIISSVAPSTLNYQHSTIPGRTPAQLINHKYTKLVKPGVHEPKSGQEAARNGWEEWYGDTYQNGVRPGPKKLAQFIEVLQLTETPALYSQEGQGDDALVHVKLFDPSGSWTWFITEFDEKEHVAFGLVDGHDTEVGYIDLNELANVAGRGGIGIEIDMHFKPQTLGACREALAARAN